MSNVAEDVNTANHRLTHPCNLIIHFWLLIKILRERTSSLFSKENTAARRADVLRAGAIEIRDSALSSKQKCCLQ